MTWKGYSAQRMCPVAQRDHESVVAVRWPPIGPGSADPHQDQADHAPRAGEAPDGRHDPPRSLVRGDRYRAFARLGLCRFASDCAVTQASQRQPWLR